MLVALLAPVGSRSGVPSMIAARAPLGYRGAQVVSGAALPHQLRVDCRQQHDCGVGVRAGARRRRTRRALWAAGLGVLATAIVARGPRAVGHADRIAVPMMVVAGGVPHVGGVHAARARHRPAPCPHRPPPLLWGLDVVIGYQVSWLLMFADYSRYTRSARAAATAVFAGLALPALWLMPVGWTLARIAGSDDPGTMLAAAGVGWWTAVLVALATVTTNFVNIYLSSLAWRTLSPQSTGAGSVWTIGLIGTALGLVSSGWLTQFAELMVLLGIGAGPGRRRLPRALRGVAKTAWMSMRSIASRRCPVQRRRHRPRGSWLHRLQARGADRRHASGTRHLDRGLWTYPLARGTRHEAP